MNAPERRPALSANLLNPRRYLQSLLEQGMRCGLLSQEAFGALQGQLLGLLAAQADRLNGGRSSSIRVEQAQDLMESLLYVLSMRLKGCASPEKALQLVQCAPLETLFEQGVEQIRRRLSVCRLMQTRILANLFETPNRFYRLTIEGGVNGFFKLYRPQFAAHETHITADYPPLLGRPALDGVEFIEQYLRRIEAENAFLRCFEAGRVHDLLRRLAPEYAEAPVNLMEPVLLRALACALLGKNPWRLELTREESACLCRALPTGAKALEERLCGALEALEERLCGALEALSARLPAHALAYARRCMGRVSAHIQAAREADTLGSLLWREEEAAAPAQFISGERMPDEAYCALVKEAQGLSGAQRVERVLASVRSLYDLIDLLSDLPWRQEEVSALVSRLPEADVQALKRLYPEEALLTRPGERMLHCALACAGDPGKA